MSYRVFGGARSGKLKAYYTEMTLAELDALAKSSGLRTLATASRVCSCRIEAQG